MPAAPRYEVQQQQFDASRPFAVLATFRHFNRCMGRYATKRQAQDRARYLTRRDDMRQLASDEASERRGMALMSGEG
jgi:hypothetical protein